MSFLAAFLAFSALIILHELGHFLAAKAVGMRVERFFLFFPPKLISFKRGETEYGVGCVPLGGFVKITGMNPEEELPADVKPRAYYSQPVWKRIVVIAAGPAVNLAIAFIILFFLAFGIQEPGKSVAEVSPGAPAEGRLLPGDRIVSVDGKKGGQAVIAEQISSHKCEGKQVDGCLAASPATVEVIRNGERKELDIRPSYDSELERTRLGFAFNTEALSPDPLEAAGIATEFGWLVASRTVSTLSQLYDADQRKELSGVAGGYEVTRQAIEIGPRQALTLIALISLSLGLINLFPFLPLDGGHIFWSVLEKIRGKPVPFGVMERAGLVGFVLVIGLFLIGLSNDIGRLTGEGFNLR